MQNKRPRPGKNQTPYEAFKGRVRRFIQSTVIETTIAGLIILSVLLIIWTSAAELKPVTRTRIQFAEELLTVVFVIELSIRFWVERRKMNFFRHYWMDILAVLPILRVLRGFRVLKLPRIFRVLRLFRVGLILTRRLSEANQVFRKAWSHYFLLSVMVFLIVLFSALAIRHFESPKSTTIEPAMLMGLGSAGAAAISAAAINDSHQRQKLSFEEAFWWAIFTVVASEPIDYSAKTTGGRIVTFLVMFSGLTFFAFLTGVSSAFMIERLRMGLSQQSIHRDDLDGHFILLGWNNRAPFIIEEIQAEPKHKSRVTVVLADRESPEDFEWLNVDRSLVYFMRGDPIAPADLENLNIPRAFSVVILSDSCHGKSDVDRDARTVLCALMVEKTDPSVFTCAELINRAHASHLKLAGVEEVVIANESSASVLAMATLHLDMTKILAELLSFKIGNQFYKIEVPDSWSNRHFVDAITIIKENYDAVCIGLIPSRREWDVKQRGCQKDRDIMINPPKSLRLKTGDQLLIIASQDFILT